MRKTILSETITEGGYAYTISITKPLGKNYHIELSERNLESNQISIIQFHPLAENKITDALTYYLQEIKAIRNTKYHKLTETKEKEICSRYLKGVEIRDLTLQFQLDEKIIKEILQKHYIEIVNQSLPEQDLKARKKRLRGRNNG